MKQRIIFCGQIWHKFTLKFVKSQQLQQNIISISSPTNFGHLKLHNQMNKQLENHKLAEKTEPDIKNQKKNRILTKIEQQKQILEISLQIEQIRKKIRQKAQEKKQRNIYTSKFLKTMTTQKITSENGIEMCLSKYQKVINDGKSQIKNENLDLNQLKNNLKENKKQNKKRKSSQSSINYFEGSIPQHRNINCVDIYQQDNGFSRSYYPGDDAMSIDTYEMQIGDDYEMPKINKTGQLRSTLTPSKYKQSIQSKTKLQQEDTSEIRFHQSAGCKRFNNIVNLLKPRFQRKKSNIYEQPQLQNQQQSIKSTSLKKSLGSKFSDNQLIQKRRQMKTKPTSSQSNLEKQIRSLKTIEKFNNDIKTIMNNKFDKQTSERHEINQKPTVYPKSDLKNPEIQTSYQNKQIIMPKSSKKYQQIFNTRACLQEKVKNAMQRTKKALNVLNKAKIKQSTASLYLKGF